MADAIQVLSMWYNKAKAKGYFITLISADIEGGFDKVNATKLMHTGIDKTYLPSI